MRAARRVPRWTRGATIAVIDQALVSGVNFATTVLLVRGLGLDEFGRFALAWMGVVFVQSLQLACIGTPMLTIAPKQEDGDAYHAAVLRLQLGFLALVLVVGAVVAPFAARAAALHVEARDMAAVLALTIARSAHDFVRQNAFARERRGFVLALDALTYGGQLTLLAVLALRGHLTPSSAVSALTAASLCGVVVGVARHGAFRAPRNAVRECFVRHARMSRWLVASSLTQWFTSNAFAVAAGTVIGPAAVGAIKAGQTIMGVLHVFLLAVENVVPVRAAALAARGATVELARYLRHVATVGGALTLSVSIVVWTFAEPLSRLMYGHDGIEFVLALRGFALLYPFAFAISVLAIRLRTEERTRPIFAAQAIGAVASAIAAHSTVLVFGLRGALAGMILQQALIFLVLALVVRRPIDAERRSARHAAREVELSPQP